MSAASTHPCLHTSWGGWCVCSSPILLPPSTTMYLLVQQPPFVYICHSNEAVNAHTTGVCALCFASCPVAWTWCRQNKTCGAAGTCKESQSAAADGVSRLVQPNNCVCLGRLMCCWCWLLQHSFEGVYFRVVLFLNNSRLRIGLFVVFGCYYSGGCSAGAAVCSQQVGVAALE